MVLMALGILMILAVLCRFLPIRAACSAGWKKAVIAIAVLAVASLTCEWFETTGAQRMVAQERPPKHTVVPHWKASSSKNVRYNIYRGSSAGVHPDKLNAAPVDGFTFTDTNVQSGRSYYYVVRAVDAAGRETSDSYETLATIP